MRASGAARGGGRTANLCTRERRSSRTKLGRIGLTPPLPSPPPTSPTPPIAERSRHPRLLRGSRGFRPGPSPPIDSDCGARLPLCKGARLLLRTARDEADRPGALWRARGARTRADHRIARRRGCAPQWRSAAAATLASAADELLRRCARSGAPPEPAPLARAWRPRTCRVAPNHSTPRRRSVSWRQLDAPRPAHERL